MRLGRSRSGTSTLDIDPDPKSGQCEIDLEAAPVDSYRDVAHPASEPVGAQEATDLALGFCGGQVVGARDEPTCLG